MEENTINQDTTQDTKLTDEQIKQVSDKLEEDIDPDTKKLREIINEDKKDSDTVDVVDGVEFPTYEQLEKQVLEKGTIDAAIDSDTGAVMPDLTGESIETSDAATSAKNAYGLDQDDMLKFIDVVRRYAAKEKFNIFASMPEKLKMMCTNMCISSGVKPTAPILNKACKELFLDPFISDMKLDEELKKFTDELKEVTGSMPDIADIYSDALKEAMVDNNLAKAKEIEEANPQGAAKLVRVADIFKDTYEYGFMYTYLETANLSRYRKSFKDSIYPREVKNFAYKTSCCKIFHIPNPESIIGILKRHFDYSDRVYKAFVMLIKYATEDLDVEDVYNAELINYSIRNIITLDLIETVKSDFNTMLLGNIDKMLNTLSEKFDTVQAE